VERQPGSRVLSVILVAIALCGLGLNIWMNGRFGWSQGDGLEDRGVMAGIHMLADPAAAALSALSGKLFATGRRWAGFHAMLWVLGFITFSMIGVNGFMSTRVGHSEGHKNAIKVQEKYLSWVQGQTVNFDRPKAVAQHEFEDRP